MPLGTVDVSLYTHAPFCNSASTSSPSLITDKPSPEAMSIVPSLLSSATLGAVPSARFASLTVTPTTFSTCGVPSMVKVKVFVSVSPSASLIV